jgi:hypothetical protein
MHAFNSFHPLIEQQSTYYKKQYIQYHSIIQSTEQLINELFFKIWKKVTFFQIHYFFNTNHHLISQKNIDMNE